MRAPSVSRFEALTEGTVCDTLNHIKTGQRCYSKQKETKSGHSERSLSGCAAPDLGLMICDMHASPERRKLRVRRANSIGGERQSPSNY